ncbi:MAG: low-specificity L-threonine aldolase [Candidatus Binataceae bacterium]
MIDLRSDTVTIPTSAMREAIARAALGDDVYGEDPTVNQLEAMAAAMLGKEAAILVPSGTMANLIALLVHCPRGMKAIVGADAHSYVYEAGGASALGGVVLTPIRNTADGGLDLDELAEHLQTPLDPHFAMPAVVALENTHNRCGGVAVPLSHMAEVRRLAAARGLPVHLDGARIFNAALALETTAPRIAASADSVSLCLSKGLACPVGSLLCGSREFIDQARRVRKMLGGGMRQAGIIAAAGIVALETMIDRLAEDHQNARALAQGLALIAGLGVKPEPRRSNMVFFEIENGEAEAARAFAAELKERAVLIGSRGPASFRAVTHYGVTREDIDRAVATAAEAAAEALNR